MTGRHSPGIKKRFLQEEFHQSLSGAVRKGEGMGKIAVLMEDWFVDVEYAEPAAFMEGKGH